MSHLTKDYGSFKLDDVSFTVPGGTIMGLIGENGAGKSTTIKCILNLVRRDGGHDHRVLGQDNLKEERAVKAEIGRGAGRDAPSTTCLAAPPGGEDSRPASTPTGTWPSTSTTWRNSASPGTRRSRSFSQGMKMKLSIAAAFAAKPRLLILDEATSGLDPVVRDEILDEFLDFIQDEDHAILLSSHITSDLEKAADYITYLHRGKVAVSGGQGRAAGHLRPAGVRPLRPGAGGPGPAGGQSGWASSAARRW